MLGKWRSVGYLIADLIRVFQLKNLQKNLVVVGWVERSVTQHLDQVGLRLRYTQPTSSTQGFR